MFIVRSVELALPELLPAIAALRAAEDWAANAWLLDLVHAWDGARIFVVRAALTAPSAASDDPTRVLAAASASAYGELGFIGNVIVQPAYRSQGLGKQLMGAALDWLVAAGVCQVELDATVQGRPLYTRLGFVATVVSWHLMAPLRNLRADGLVTDPDQVRIEPLDAATIERVAQLDRDAFGGDRRGLLALMLGLSESYGWMATDESSSPRGYLIVRPPEHGRPGWRIGPWIAQSPSVAAALLRHAVGSAEGARLLSGGASPALLAVVPGASEVVLEFYRSVGMALARDDLRMRWALPCASERSVITRPRGRADWVYAMLAPMVG